MRLLDLTRLVEEERTLMGMARHPVIVAEKCRDGPTNLAPCCSTCIHGVTTEAVEESMSQYAHLAHSDPTDAMHFALKDE